MTNQQHPITPPHEQIEKWQDKFFETEPFLQLHDDNNLVVLLNQVYQAGADHELEACCEWLCSSSGNYYADIAVKLLAARRSKPLSLKEQALEALTKIEDNKATYLDSSVIRRALEQLND